MMFRPLQVFPLPLQDFPPSAPKIPDGPGENLGIKEKELKKKHSELKIKNQSPLRGDECFNGGKLQICTERKMNGSKPPFEIIKDTRHKDTRHKT